MGAHFEAWGRALVTHRWAGLLLSLLITAASIAAIGQRVAEGVPVDFTPQALFLDHGPEVKRLATLQAWYGREDNDVVFLAEGPLGTQEGVAWLRALDEALLALPEVERVESLIDANMAHLDGDTLRVVQPFERWPPEQAVQQMVLDPALRGLLISGDGELSAIRVTLDRDLQKIADIAPAVAAVVDTAQAVPRPQALSLRPTGVPFIRAEVVAMMLADEARFLPLVAGLFALATGLLFRRFWSGLAPLFVTLIGTLWAMGALMASGATLNVLSVLVPTLTVVIGVSDGVHIVARYREELDPGDGPPVAPVDAMAATMRHMTAACFLTTFTTAAGFSSLVVADTAVVRDFGWQCAVAVMVTWLAVMLVLPVWLAFVPTHRVGGRLDGRFGTPALARIDRMVARHPRLVLMTSLLVAVVALVIGSGVRTQSSILEMYHPGHATYQAVKTADTRLGGIVPVMVHVELPADAPAEGMLDPAILRPMAALQDWMVARPEVGWGTSPASVVRHLHLTLTGEDEVPDTRAAVAQELLLAELSGDLPLDRVLASDRSSGRILLLTRDVGGRVMMQLQRDTKRQAQALFAGTGATIDVTGDGFIASVGVERLVSDLVDSLGLVLIVITLTMWLLMRDLPTALVASVPNVVPLVFTLATLGLMGADLQVTNIVSFTVAVGLAVDDTIHFVVRFREERGRGASVDDAISATYQGAGRAIVLTSLLLVSGFGVLAMSDLTSTRFFGILAAVTMGAALLADLFLLPALLHLVGDRSKAVAIEDMD